MENLMNTLKDLISIANKLDEIGLYKEADLVDNVLSTVLPFPGTPNISSNIRERALDWTQVALDVGGFVPGFGEIADGINVAISAYREDPVGVILSSISMIAGVGDIIAKSAKVCIWAIKKGLKVIRVGAASYNVSSVANFVLEQVEMYNRQIQDVLQILDEKTNQTKGYFQEKFDALILAPISEAGD